MSKRIVIALGGNALGNTAAQQLELVSLTAKPIVDLIAAGNEVIIAHGNGPQVGMINLGLSTAAEAGAIKSDMPFPECGAMSQGYIGYHLQNAIGNELTARGLRKDVATVVTQVLVDENDPAFQHPTKPIGSFYDKVAADRIMAQRGCTMVEDAGRGWRQVVPSPKPVDVIEKNTVRALVDSGTVVITVGGGGIPVVRRNGRLVGTPAVIDKDFASAKLAELLHADKAAIARRTKNLEAKGLLIRRDAPSDRRSQLLYPTKKAESLRSSKAEIEAAFYEYLTNVLTAEEAAAFAAALNKLYTASKTESRAGFPHFRKAAGGEAAHEKG